MALPGSIVKSYMKENWWDIELPATLKDQNFGHEISAGKAIGIFMYDSVFTSRKMRQLLANPGYSHVEGNSQCFRIWLKLSDFKPEEIDVKYENRFVTVHCKHDAKAEGGGKVSREMTRSYMLPKDCHEDDISAFVSEESVLFIGVTKKQQPLAKEKDIFVVRVNQKDIPPATVPPRTRRDSGN